MHNHVHHASAFVLTPPYGPPLRRTALALLLASCFGAAQANPALPQVVNGQATFNQQGNIFSITNTPNTIINWQSFSIHAGEITRFIQQNGNSAVLNRITGQDPSKILGSLESNGKVFLINPNGIVFGQGAKVDVNGLVASSLGMSNEDFLSGKRQFTAGGVAGGVSNAGVINAGKGGQVLLIAPNVENTGIITAPNGEVILAAGRNVQLADPGNPDLRVLVSAPQDQALNLGQIIAQGGSIGMAGALVSQRGVLNANSAVVGENGRIMLKASGKAVLEAGSVTSATGAAGKGGEIAVLGDQVGLFGDARVDASGATSGGTVLLGGDYQGKNAAVQNARQVVVNKDASIAADATDRGQGGKVIVWGTESAQVHGSISARGGAHGGDGGFVETSGHSLAVDGIRVDTGTRAGSGKRGTWLLDPFDIDVIAGSGASLGEVDSFLDPPASGTSSVSADLISNATSDVLLQAQHDINFKAAIAIVKSGVGLKAQAGNKITVEQAITTNGGAIFLSANDNAGSTAQGAPAVLNIGAAISSQGGKVTLTGADVVFSASGSLNVAGGDAELRANRFEGNISLNGSGGQIRGEGALGQTLLLQADNMQLLGGVAFGGAAGNGSVRLQVESEVLHRQINLGSKAGGKLSLSSADLNAISAGVVSLGNTGMTGKIASDQALTIAGPGQLRLETANAIALDQGFSTTGDLTLHAGTTLSAAGALAVDGSFVLDGGNWVQNGATLPGFGARSFVIGSGATFLRVAGGDGGTSAPYLIADIYGLQGIGSLGLGNSYRLAGNIDASGTANWNGGKGFIPIAGGGAAYSGVFDGAGFAIGNLAIDGRTYDSPVGLFGTLQGGTLRNLTLAGGSVAGNANVGALVGNVLGGTIDNVSSSAAVSGQRNVGGLVGSNGGMISASGASGAVSGLNSDAAGSIGGLVGLNQAGASITASMASGAVTGTRAMVGGLVGNNEGAVAQSYATGAVSGAANIGGLVGRNGGSISNAYATGAVGAAANSDPALIHENLGGLIGWSVAGSSASNVYSSGAVSGNGFAAGTAGGVVGRADTGAAVSFAFWNYETAGIQMDQGGASGRTTAQMQQQGSFNGYDFSSVWRIYDGYTTPMLKAFLKPLRVNVTDNASGKVYDGQLAAFLGTIGYVGLLDGDTGVNGSLGYGNALNVGNYNLTGLWSTKYDITLGGTTTFAITPRVLTVSMGGNGKVYDGTLGYDGASFVLGNVVTGDNISISGSAAFLDKNAGSGKAVHASGLVLGGNELGNYSLAASTLDGTADITARLLSYGVSGAQNRVYDGTTSAALSGYFEGLVSGDQVAMAGLLGSFRDKNAGNGKVVDYQVSTGHLTGQDAGNYVLNANSGSTTADISARTLNVSLSGVNKTYDGTVAAGVTFGDDRIAGDTLTVAGNAAFGDKNAGTGKTVSVSNVALGGLDAGNYVLNANTGSTTADIAARTLNVSLSGVNKTYDGTTGAVVHFGDDRIAGDTLTVAGSAAFGDKNAGTGKTVNVSNVALAGLDAGNYVLNASSGSTTADIAARALNVSLSGVNKTYDGTVAAGVTFGDDRIAGDTLTVAANAAFGDKNAGTGKTINVSNVALGGLDAGNYVLNASSGSTTADIAARTLNVSLSGVNKTYDGTTGAVVHFGDDRIAGDTLSVAGNAAFGDKNAGAGKTVNVSDVALAGLDAGNYVLNANTGSTTADIAARTLNVSLSGVNKTYDGTVSAGVTFGDDRIAGDTLTVAGNAAFGDKNAGTGKTVNVSNVALAGLDAGNYVLNASSGSTTADIAARMLNVSLSGVNKTYDGTTGAVVHFGDDRIAGDTLSVAGNAAFGDKNAGTGKTVNVSNVALAGLDAGNYVLSSSAGSTTADIAARTLNVSLSGVNKTYDGTTGAVVHFGDDRIAGDTLTVAGNAAFGDKNAGTGKTVNVSNVALAGLDAGNYVLNANSGSTTADIAARTLNVSLSGVNKTYDGTTGAVVHFGDDRIAGDTLTVAGNAAFGDKNAGTGKTVNVSNVALAGLDAGNYVLNANSGSTTADIAARTLNVSLSGVNKTYDGTVAAGVTFGDDRIAGDTLTVAGNAAFGDKNAGAGKTVNVSNVALAGLDAGNYVLNANTGSTTADIAARTLNVSLSGVNKTYDGSVAAGVTFGDDRIAGDTLTVAGNAAFGDKNAGTGKTVSVSNVAVAGLDAGNYVLNANSGSTTADIAARTLNVSLSGVNKTYDGTVAAGVTFGDDRIAGDTLTVAGSAAFGDKNAGTGKTVNVSNVALGGLDADNYVLNANTGSTTADIAARTLNVSLSGVNKTYDGTTGAVVHFGDDRIAGDTLTVAGNAAFGDKNAGTGKTVNVSNVALGGLDAGNYVLNASSGSTTADIAARTLNVSLSGVNKTYDGTTGAVVHFGDDRIAGDTLTVAGSAAFGDKNAGTGKTVNVSNVALAGLDAGNYVLNANTGSTTADIAARTLNVSLSGVNKTYDGTTGAVVHFGDDRIAGDALTVAGNAAFGDKNAGTGKTVNVSNVALAGLDAGNYVLNANTGSTTADIAARTLNVSLSGVNKTYDGTTGAVVHFGDDRIAGDTLTVAGNAAFGDKNAGTGKTVNVSNVALGGLDAGNYVLNANTGSTTADIAARTLNVSLSGVNKTYDGTTGAVVHFGDDRIAGDTLTVAGNAAFGDKNAGAGKTVNVSNVALAGLDAGNYVLSANAGSTTADIAARALHLSGVAGNKVYDGMTGTQVVLGDDRIAGDSLTASAVANFSDKNVGTGKAVNLTGAALAGADAANYFIVLPTGLLASITPASLTLGGVSAAGKVYDGSTSATVSATATGILGQDVVSVVGGSGSFADKNAGVGKVVTASGFRLAGADAGNYTLDTTGGTAQATIAQKQMSTWVGNGGGLWSDAANWDGGVVPEGANVLAVDFSNSSGVITYNAAAGNTILKNINSASGLLLTGGSLTLGESVLDRSVLSGLAGLEISGGSLLLNGSLSSGRYAQNGGVLSGTGNLLVANSFSQVAGAIRLAGQLSITQASGDLRFASLAANEVRLNALAGAIGQDGALVAGSLTAQAQNGIVLGNAGNQVGSFSASNSAGGGIVLNNTSAPGQLTLGTLVTGAGNIAIDNTGGIAAGDINANGGNVTLTAHSPVTVGGKLQGNTIALNASTDVVLGDGAQLAAARDVSLVAGGDIRLEGNAKVVGGGNFSASAGANVRFADTASVTLPAAAGMNVLAKAGSITGAPGVRINRQRTGVTLLAPNGAVSMADAIFLPATTVDKPVIDAGASAAITDSLRIIKQADRANDPLAAPPPAKPDDKKTDSKEVADATDKPTGYKFDDAAKKMYCN